MTDPANCTCLCCTLNRAFQAWIYVQPDLSVDQQDVTKMLIHFLGEALSSMPLYANLCPLRIEVTASKAAIEGEAVEKKPH